MIKNNVFKQFSTFGMAVFFGLSVLPVGKLSGYEVGAIVLLLTGVIFLFTPSRRQIKLDRSDKWLLLAGLMYVLVSCFEVWVDHQPIRGYDHASRFILTLPIFLLLLVYPPHAKHFFMAAAVGGLLLGGTSMYYKFILDQPSTFGMLSIQYAFISMVIATISLAGIGYFYQGRRKAWCLMSLIGCVLGVVAVALSFSRGSWASIFVMLTLTFWVYRHALKPKLVLFIVIMVMGLCASLYLAPQTTVKSRVVDVYTDINSWQEGRQDRTSMGERFMMWENAIELVQEKWVLGWGTQGFMAAKKRMQEAGKINEFVQVYEHPHNELLNAWVKRGIPGVVALLLLYIVPILTFKRYLHPTYSVALKSVALACISVPICFLIAGLSQTVLAHNSGVLFYVMAITLCWGILKGTVAEQTGTGSATLVQ